MATTIRDAASGKLVVSSTAHNERSSLSATDRVVRVKRPIALQPDENAFIEKTLHYISGVPGADTKKLVLTTNTKYPTRYVMLIRGMPTVTLEDLQNIRDMNERIRNITICMVDETIRVDVWRHAPPRRRVSKRKREKEVVAAECDLSSVDKRDKKCLQMLLFRLNALDDVECQFGVRVDTSHPEHYNIDLRIIDELKLHPLENIMHECRSFCMGFDFDFPRNVIRAKCLRLAAPLKRRVLRISS